MQKITPFLTDIIISTIIFFTSLVIYNIDIQSQYIVILVITNILFSFGFYLQNLYKNLFNNIFEVIVKIFRSWIIISGVVFTAIFMLNFDDLGRKITLTWITLTPIFLIIIRYLLQKIFKREKIIISVFGNKYQWSKYELQRLKKQNIELQTIDNIDNCKNDMVLLNTDEYINHINIQANYITLANFMERYLRKCHIENIDFVGEIKEFNNTQKFLKLIIDIFLVALILPIFLIILPISYVAIQMQSKGKLFFTQIRIGIKNQKFTALKFRSMHENSHFDPYTKQNDTRIFPYGNVMRKTRIDELPQIINVLKREMSIIGPRAEWEILVENYEKDLPYYNLRHLIKPGISGWAQVNYPYGENLEDTKQKLMYDLYYIKNWNLALELETIVRTFFVVVGKKGL